MAQSVYPSAGGGGYTLRQTITATGAVTIPSGQSFVYAKIGSSETAATAQGWIPADNSYSSVSTPAGNTLYYYSFLVGSGPNLYIYY